MADVERPRKRASVCRRTSRIFRLNGSSDDGSENRTIHGRRQLSLDRERSLIQRDGSTHKSGLLTSAATQIIGWDPRTGHVRSWSFDSSGGYSTGYWWSTPEEVGVPSARIPVDCTRRALGGRPPIARAITTDHSNDHDRRWPVRGSQPMICVAVQDHRLFLWVLPSRWMKFLFAIQ